MNVSDITKKDSMDATLKRNLQKLKEKKKAIVKQHAAPGQQLNPNLIKSLQLDMFLKETPTIEHEQSGGAPQISSVQANTQKVCDHVEHEEISFDEFGNSKEVKTELNILEWKQACRSCKDMNSLVTSQTRPRGAQSSDIRKSQLKMTGKLATMNSASKPTVNDNQFKSIITSLKKENANLKIELDDYYKRSNQTDPETDQVLRISHRLFLQLLSMFEEPLNLPPPSQQIDTIKRSKKLISDSGITVKLAKVLQKISLQIVPQESKYSQTDKHDQAHEECKSLLTLLEQQITELQKEGLQNLKQITGLSDQLTRAKSGEQRINFMTSEIQKLNMILLQKDTQLKDAWKDRESISAQLKCSTVDQQVDVNILLPCENCQIATLRLENLVPQLEQQLNLLKKENIHLTQYISDQESKLSQVIDGLEKEKVLLNAQLMIADKENKKQGQDILQLNKEYQQQLIEMKVEHEVKLVEMATDKQILSQSENELQQMIEELKKQTLKLNQSKDEKDQLITWMQFTLNNFSHQNIDRQIQEFNTILQNDQHQLQQLLSLHLKQELIALRQQNQGNGLQLFKIAVLKKLIWQLIGKFEDLSQQNKVLEESRARTKNTVQDIKMYLKGHQNEEGFEKCNALLLTVDCQLQQDLIKQINITLDQQQKKIQDLQQQKNFQLNEYEILVRSLKTELETVKGQQQQTQQQSVVQLQQRDLQTEQLEKNYQNIIIQTEQLKLDQEKKNQELTQIQIENMKLKAQQIQTTNLIKNQHEDTIKLLKQQFETELMKNQEILQDEIDKLKSVINQYERSQIMNQELLDEENQLKDQEIAELKIKIIRLEEELKKLEKEKTLWVDQKLDLLNNHITDDKSVFQDSYLNSSLNTSTLHQPAIANSLQIDKDLLQILNLQAHVIESDLIK